MRWIRIILFGLWLNLLLWPVIRPIRDAHASLPTQDEPQAGEYRTGRLIVGWQQNAGPRVMASVPGVSAVGAYSGLEKVGAGVLAVPEGQEAEYRERLLETPGVTFVEYDLPVSADLEPDDPFWSRQYGPPDIGATEAWDVTTGASDVILAVLDSGIDAAHPEFAGRLVAGYDWVSRDTIPEDLCGHGTHVAGIAAASGNNTAGIAGMTWGARIMPVRVLDDLCSGWISDVASGIVYAADNGADVINLSLGVNSTSNLLEYATYYAYQQGATLIAAAGNGASVVLSYPARYPWVLAVGSVNSARVKAATSNSSNSQDDLLVMAPGVSIFSTAPLGSFYYQTLFGLTREYGTLSGTSMAAPHAAGAATLLASLPAFDTPARIYEALYRTTVDLGPAGWDPGYGYGLIQVDAALAFDDFTPPPEPPEITVEYDHVTSRDCPAVAYTWVDARTGGMQVPMFGTDWGTRVTLPFDFDFGGVVYDEMVVSANGYLAFDISEGAATPRNNFLIPWIEAPNEYIAPFWDDLNPSAGGAVYARDLGDRYVVEWWQIPRQGYSDLESRLTFEVVLYRDSGNILFQYQTLAGPGANGSSATVGVEYAEGTAGAQYLYNRGGLQAESAILWVPAEPGSTRDVLGCLYTTSTDFFDCAQTPTFGVHIPDEILPAEAALTIRAWRNAPGAPRGAQTLDRYAEILVDPSPPTPFSPPALVCYHYSAADLLKAGGRASNLYLAVYNNASESWERLVTGLNAGEARLSASVTHFSLYGVFADAPSDLPVTGSSLPGWLLATALTAGVSWTMLLLLKGRK